MQAVATTAGGRIVNRQMQIIAAEEPFESASGFFAPALVSGDAIRFETRGDHGLGFDRLLIEARALAAAFIKAIGADGNKMASARSERCKSASQQSDSSPASVISSFGIHCPHMSSACGSAALQ